MPIKEKIDITFKKPSFFLAFKNLKVTGEETQNLPLSKIIEIITKQKNSI